jgi:hypothetical protein
MIQHVEYTVNPSTTILYEKIVVTIRALRKSDNVCVTNSIFGMSIHTNEMERSRMIKKGVEKLISSKYYKQCNPEDLYFTIEEDTIINTRETFDARAWVA